MFKDMVGLKWFVWLPLLFVADQFSKWWVLKNLQLGESIPVIPTINFTLAQNHGIAFSLFSKQAGIGHILLVVFIIGICLFIARWLAKTPVQDKLTGTSLVLILGGALGNLCDRFWHGYVVDFIDFYVGSWHFYIFNIADTFVSIGAALMVISLLFFDQKQ